MSVDSDQSELTMLFSDDVKVGDQHYADRQLQYLQPSNSTYNLSVDFDTRDITDRYVSWTEAYLALPITITGAANFAGVPPPVAFKSSVLSLFQGVQIKTSTGQVLVDERNSLAFANHLRLMFERDDDWYQCHADELHFARDRPASGVAGLRTNAHKVNPNISKYSAVPAVGVPGDAGNGDSAFYNVGFHERQQALVKAAHSDIGAPPANWNTISTVIPIKLKYIHEFFDKLDFPIARVRFQFSFLLNNAANSAFVPITIGATEVNAGANVQAVGGPNVSVAITPGTTPLLYYHAVKLTGAQMAIEQQRLTKGYKKEIRFREYDLIQNVPTQQNLVSGNTFQYQITSSAVAPRRVWALAYPTGQVLTSHWPSVLVTSGGLKQVQLLLNNKSYYDNPISSLHEQYELLRQSFHMGMDSGELESLLPYQDFRLSSRMLCCDLNRAIPNMTDPNGPVSIVIQATVEAEANVDMVYLVERERMVELDFASGSITAKVGPALFM